MVEGARRYLVIEPVRLVAEDLALLIAEAEAGAEVHVADSAAQAGALLAGLSDLAAVLINLPPAALREAGLLPRLHAASRRLVWFGEPPAEGECGALCLDMPFDAGAVAALLARLREG